MKNGKCVKCQSTEVYAAKGGAGFDNKINLQYPAGIMTNTAKWMSYLCLSCGYFENYIIDEDKLARIAENPAKAGWSKISG